MPVSGSPRWCPEEGPRAYSHRKAEGQRAVGLTEMVEVGSAGAFRPGKDDIHRAVRMADSGGGARPAGFQPEGGRAVSAARCSIPSSSVGAIPPLLTPNPPSIKGYLTTRGSFYLFPE